MLTTDEISRFISDDRNSERKRRARVGMRYYEGEHDIRKYRLFYYDADGNLVEDKTRSNVKIPHPFFTELVDQCVQYMLSGDTFVRAEDPTLQEALDGYFGEDFAAELSEALTDTCAKGFSYLYAYKADSGRTEFMHAQGEVIEVRAREADANAEHVIYWYVDRVDKNRKVIKRIQVWDEKETRYYVQVDDGLVAADNSVEMNPRPHIVAETKDGLYGGSLGYVPFFRLDANRKQHSHLRPIKNLIDDYDIMSCGLSNNIQDANEVLYVVRGFEGDDLGELMQNLRTKKAVGTGDSGGVDIQTIDIPYEARMNKLDVDEKNIYRFGMGLNTAQVGDGNVTNVVIKSRYALLDLKANKLEKRLRKLLKRLVEIALDEINAQGDTGYTFADVEIRFEREVMTNAADNAQIELAKAQTKQAELATLLNAASVYGEEAVLESVCQLLDLDADEVRELAQEPETGGLEGAVAALTGDE